MFFLPDYSPSGNRCLNCYPDREKSVFNDLTGSITGDSLVVKSLWNLGSKNKKVKSKKYRQDQFSKPYSDKMLKECPGYTCTGVEIMCFHTSGINNLRGRHKLL